MAKKFGIDVTASAFDRNQQRESINDEIKPYNGVLAEMNRRVEKLDRYDDFSMLRISPTCYAQEEEGAIYGIDIHRQGGTHSVIWPNQQAAASAFLKELRGFGLLADVVGSGKTFEACVVLSELAVRDKINSLLLVVPEQVYDNWVTVLERYFGLGVDRLQRVEGLELNRLKCRAVGEFLSPVQPIIVKTEDFVEWSDEAKRLLFDVIVVDEAHHLCTEEGKYANAMRLLSLMMETKKKANKTYCLLLSATPHAGNLEHMFRLWYFIRCKGGNPSDFEVKEDGNRTEEYQKEKRYYKEHVCRGAATVMEFIKKVKLFEVTHTHAAAFEKYLKAQNEQNFDKKTESEQILIVNEFLDTDEVIEERVNKAIAGAYHNGVLRSIMIRQPNSLIAKKKLVENFLFFPMAEQPALLQTKGLKGEKVTVDLVNLNQGKSVTVGNESFTLDEYVEENRGNQKFAHAMAEFVISRIVNQVGTPASIFEKANSGTYYWEQWKNLPSGVISRLLPYLHGEDGFTHKFNKAKELLAKHPDSRVLVFFDYESKRGKAVADRFERELQQDPAFANRILVGTGGKGKAKTVADFDDDKNANAILIVKDASFTEGVNLQKSNVIINFQVTPDPLAMDQRIGRIFRMGQESDVHIYSLADMHKLEGYVLTYFARIGLLSSNSGDATIIAGSNNDRMVTVRCPVCKSVKLMPLEEYEMKKRNGDLYCTLTAACRQDNPDGMMMEEISTYDFKCDKCDTVFTRSAEEEGYQCVSTNNDEHGVMCNSGEEGDRSVYCRKICAVAHCSRFTTGDMAGKCAALAAYTQDKTISDGSLMLLCQRCPNRAECSKKCRIGTGAEAIRGCRGCDMSDCSPTPHVVNFNDKWEAKCPVCEANGAKGRLRPIVARTFATYIRAAWNFKIDGGAAFCNNLKNEAKNVANIKIILDNDQN